MPIPGYGRQATGWSRVNLTDVSRQMSRSGENENAFSFSSLLQFMEQKDSYPHGPGRINHIQTHISHVFIAGSYVYKIKKPVNLGFLDFSTLERRKHYCEREVALNRRLCAGIYLGVIPVYRKGGSFTFEGSKKEAPVEYAVKMERLSNEHFLNEKIKEGALTKRELDRVADKLTSFYQDQQPGQKILEWGKIKNIRINTGENFRQTGSFIGKTINEAAYNAIKQFTNGYLETHELLFKKRIKERRIIDGHGDLHLNHIHVTPDRVCIYDCIEFNERFRYQDMAGDLAYLAMDLDFNNLPSYSSYFIRQMADKLQDTGLERIIEFYKCYRAYVRGKVKSMESSEEEVSEENRAQAATMAANYFDLALKYALLGSGPGILIFMGEVASGKSTLAEQLSRMPGLERYASDPIRKTIAGLSLTERAPASQRDKLYAPEMSAKTYAFIYEKMERAIHKDKSVVLDATFNRRVYRKKLVKKLNSLDVNYFFIETRASAGVLRRRLKERGEKDDIISDARMEDFETLHERYDPPGEIDPSHFIQIKTDQPLEESDRKSVV